MARAQVGDVVHVPGWARWHDGVMAGWVSEGDMMVRCQAACMTTWARARREGEGDGDGDGACICGKGMWRDEAKVRHHHRRMTCRC